MRTRRASVAEEQSYFDSRLSTVMSLDSKLNRPSFQFTLANFVLALIIQFNH